MQANPGAFPPPLSGAARSSAAQATSNFQNLHKGSSGFNLNPGATPETMSQMASTTRNLQSQWQAVLRQQGQPVPIEELLDRRLFGNASNETSLMASPAGSGLSVSCQALSSAAQPLTCRSPAALTSQEKTSCHV